MKLITLKEFGAWIHVSPASMSRYFNTKTGIWRDMPRKKTVKKINAYIPKTASYSLRNISVSEFDTEEVLNYLTSKFNQNV
jgi:hypothetical protein